MKTKVTIKKDVKIDSLPEEVYFLSDSQDVDFVKELMPKRIAKNYDSFFVTIQDGEYNNIWGMVGTIPYTYKTVDQIIVELV